MASPDHFALKQLASGVHAAIGTPGGAAVSNAGIIDLGDRTLIFDTFETPLAARQLQVAAESLTGRPASFVINSHVHADHWGGNQVFAGRTPIISSHATRTEMPAATAWLVELIDNPAELVQAIEEERVALQAEADPRRVTSLEISIARMTGWLDVHPTLDLCLPDLTFSDRLTFHGSRRTAELVGVAPAHTSSDAYLALPQDGIIFMGDLGFFRCQPFMVYCEPRAWDAQLQEMEQLGIEVFVPGHGPVGSKDDIALQRRYIELIQQLVARVIRSGGTIADAVNEPLPPPFDGWLHGSMGRWDANVHAIFERQSGDLAD